MDKNKRALEEPAMFYGRKVGLGDIEFEPIDNMMETLRSRGYITFDEFIDRLSKYSC